jgi:hypothetical protein
LAYNKYSTNFICPLNTIITRLKINGTWYNLPSLPIDLASPTLVTDLNVVLNSVPFPTITFGNEPSPTPGTIDIKAVCTEEVVDEIEINSGGLGVLTTQVFTSTACTKGVACTPSLIVTADIDFDCDTQIFRYQDTTKEYNALTNPNGYGVTAPSSIANIQNIDFALWDGVTLVGVFNSPYLPNALGTSYIDLNSINFGLVTFEPNKTYTLEYRINTIRGNQGVCISTPLLIPCCGGSILSNNRVKFSVLEKLGCKSIEFTDTSGVYSLTNTGGYGTPNYDYSDITSTLIRVTRADGLVFDITDFIPTALTPSVIINGYQIGYGTASSPEVITSQVVKIEYFVYTSLACRIGYMEQDVLFHCQLKNCIQNRAIEVLKEDCESCEKNNAQEVLNMLLNYQAILITSQHNVSCLKKVIENLLFDCLKGCNGCN